MAINNPIYLAIVDTGAYKTVIDIEMAKAQGLKVWAIEGGFCEFGVPGSGIVHDYAGAMYYPCNLHLNQRVKYLVKDQRVITHPFPMMLHGFDVLQRAEPCLGGAMWEWI